MWSCASRSLAQSFSRSPTCARHSTLSYTALLHKPAPHTAARTRLLIQVS
jgi:hypothetical protein